MHALSAPKVFYPFYQAHCPLPFFQMELIQYNTFQPLNSSISMLSAYGLKFWHEVISNKTDTVKPKVSPQFVSLLVKKILVLLYQKIVAVIN